MDTGELDVYTLTREQLEAAAALFAPAVRVLSHRRPAVPNPRPCRL